MKLKHSMSTHQGMVRSSNQDAHGSNRDLLYVVCDGVGGIPYGDIASKLASKTALSVATRHPTDPWARTVDSFNAAAIALQMQKDTKHRYMSTTMVSLAFDPRLEAAVVGSCGDSRVYLVRGNTITQLTKDQAEGGVLMDVLSADSRLPKPQFDMIATKPRDKFVLCSDGVTNELSDEEILQIVTHIGNRTLASALVRAAVMGPGHGRDNATAIVVELH